MLANVFGSHTMHIEPIYIEQLRTHLHLNIYVSSIQLHSIDNFQDDTLCGTDASVDVSTRENLEKLACQNWGELIEKARFKGKFGEWSYGADRQR